MGPRLIHIASGREWRGGQNQVRLLARALGRMPGVSQEVITGRGSELASRLRAAEVPVREVSWTAALDPRALISAIAAATPDAILHAHDAHALVLAGIASRLRGRPLVVTRRVDFHLRRPGFWRRADRVVAISEAVRAVLLADGIEPGRVHVVHSGIDPLEPRSAPPFGIRERLGLAPNLPLVVNVAALVGHKDQATLIRSAQYLAPQVPGLHWVIAGEGPLRHALERQIAAAGLGTCVHLMGQVSNPWGLIREAGVFVMSSREEGLGTSILDAMALGTPVVATRAGGIPEMLDGGAGLLVNPEDPAALADAVLRVINSPETAEALRERATARLEQFTDRRMAEGMLAVYRSVG